MGLFSFFNRKNGHTKSFNEADLSNSENLPADKTSNTEKTDASPTENGINLLFHFLEKNYEKKGYDDALINPDNTHLEHNIAALKNDLERTIRKVKTFYEDFLRRA